jgi:hypothetical protein
MFRSIRFLAAILPCAVSSVFAGPKIEFDVRTFNCGVVIEGKTDKLNAVFTVRNTGNTLLKLTNVKPGCGCTVVKYDSQIKPGRSAKIESQVNIKGYNSGPISKGITVTSNAENEPSVRLTIEAVVQAVIAVSESYVNLDSKNTTVPHTIVLSSKKADLTVSDVSFRQNGNGKSPEWQSAIPFVIKHTFVSADSMRADSSRVFKLDLYFPGTDKTVSGDFIIKTNHPDKPEIIVRGEITR